MYKKSCCATPGVGVSVGIGSGTSVSKILKLCVIKLLYMIGKALSGELSCTCTGLVNLPVQLYRKSYCIIPWVGGGGGISKKLRFIIMKIFIYDGQRVVRQAILYLDRSC